MTDLNDYLEKTKNLRYELALLQTNTTNLQKQSIAECLLIWGAGMIEKLIDTDNYQGSIKPRLVDDIINLLHIKNKKWEDK